MSSTSDEESLPGDSLRCDVHGVEDKGKRDVDGPEDNVEGKGKRPVVGAEVGGNTLIRLKPSIFLATCTMNEGKELSFKMCES